MPGGILGEALMALLSCRKITAILSIALWIVLPAMELLYGVPSPVHDARMRAHLPSASVLASAVAILDEDRELQTALIPVGGFSPKRDIHNQLKYVIDLRSVCVDGKVSIYKLCSRLLI